jgi:hypothetical protein
MRVPKIVKRAGGMVIRSPGILLRGTLGGLDSLVLEPLRPELPISEKPVGNIENVSITPLSLSQYLRDAHGSMRIEYPGGKRPRKIKSYRKLNENEPTEEDYRLMERELKSELSWRGCNTGFGYRTHEVYDHTGRYIVAEVVPGNAVGERSKDNWGAKGF